MIRLRKSEDRGSVDLGWLNSRHSFSFGDYYDPKHMGWGNLRVINEDRVAPGAGFGTHGHRDMEIVSYVLSGVLAHRDSLGHVESIPAGDVQRMSAGTGVMHSEFNHSLEAVTHFLQIWIEPDAQGIAPSYEQKTVPVAAKHGKLLLIASRDGGQHAVKMFADASIYAGIFDSGQSARAPQDPKRKSYVHLIAGRLTVNGIGLEAGDAALVEDENELRLYDGRAAEVLVFDLRA